MGEAGEFDTDMSIPPVSAEENWGEVECVYGPDYYNIDDELNALNELLKGELVHAVCTEYLKYCFQIDDIQVRLSVTTNDNITFDVVFDFEEGTDKSKISQIIVNFLRSPRFSGLVAVFNGKLNDCYVSISYIRNNKQFSLKVNEQETYKKYLDIQIDI